MSASSDTQFGFNFDPDPSGQQVEIAEPEEEIFDPPEIESPTQTFLLPEIEEETRERESKQEEEIPWADYIRMVQLFFNEAQHEEFRDLTSKLAVLYGTKSVTDTVAEAMRRAALRSKV